MKQKKYISIFLLLFFVELLYPLYGSLIDENITLSGVTSTATIQPFSIHSVMDGSYQSSLNSWVENNFPGRKALIKLRSQLLFSLGKESPNNNVIIGKDNYLFESGYILTELGISRATEPEYFQNLLNKLERLDQILKENGKELYLFITPSKAHFFRDKIPDLYLKCAQIISEPNDYTQFLEYLQKTDLHYFDSRSYIESLQGEDIGAPTYYPTGTHWSSSYGYRAAKAFSEYISDKGKWPLAKIEITESPCESPVWPDADLYQSLNLIAAPNHVQYYQNVITVIEEGEHPNVFVRGGSFLSQSINGLIQAGLFGKDVHFENNYYFLDRYSKTKILSAFTSYDEFPEMPGLLAQSDILILEVNENAIQRMSFGFIDYVLTHPEWFVKSES